MERAESGRSEPDELAVKRAVAGDQQSLEVLLSQAGPSLRATLAGDISPAWQSVIDADDVLQVTYLEAFLRIRQFRGTTMAAFVSWLRQTAGNNLKDAMKALAAAKRPDPRRRIRSPGGDESYVALYELVGATTTTPSRHVAAGELRFVLEQAMERLPRDYRDVLRKYELEGQSVDDVAAALGKSRGAVYMIRARALDAAREVLPSVSKLL